MARIRSMKPEFWLDRKLARTLTRDERMLYMGLWNQADEHGRALGDPNVVKGAVFPYDDDLPPSVIEAMLRKLHCVGVVQQYEYDGDPYLFLPKLGQHQRLEPHKTPSRHPAPPKTAPDSGIVPDHAAPAPEESAQIPASALPADDLFVDQQEPTDPESPQILPEESAPAPEESSLLYVAGSMEHGAGNKKTCPTAPPPDDSSSAKVHRKPDPPGFQDFWAVYPARVARGAAVRAFATALKKVDPAVIVDGAARYATDPNRSDQFTANPATWLNGERWSDGPLPDRRPRGSPPGPSKGDLKVQNILDTGARLVADDQNRRKEITR